LVTAGQREVRKGCRRVNIVQILLHMYVNGITLPVETVPGMGVCVCGGEEIKENGG
jgi:hypothetical protein